MTWVTRKESEMIDRWITRERPERRPYAEANWWCPFCGAEIDYDYDEQTEEEWTCPHCGESMGRDELDEE